MHKTDPWLPIAQACMALHQIHTLRDGETMEDFPPHCLTSFHCTGISCAEKRHTIFSTQSFVNISLIRQSLVPTFSQVSKRVHRIQLCVVRPKQQARLYLLVLIPSNDDVSMLLTIFLQYAVPEIEVC